MKILWLINIRMPRIDRILNSSTTFWGGGWLTGLSDKLLENKEYELVVCYPNMTNKKKEYGNEGNFTFYGINVDAKDMENATIDIAETTENFMRILMEEKPDVIHIHGTEYLLSHALVLAARKLNILNRLAVSIQGLVSIYSKHYYANLPEKVIKNTTIHEIITKSSLKHGWKRYRLRGEFEIKTIKMVNNIIGRTNWDKACSYILNPNAVYFHCNETLRSEFYGEQWGFENSHKYSIIVSQATKPLKGFHKLIEAVEIVKQFYPGVKVLVAGNNVIEKNMVRRSSYSNYIFSLLKKYNINGNFEFLGNLNSEQMKNAMLNSNVFVCPSSIENSPNSLGEAMLLGVPCIASDVGGVSDMIEHKKEGFVYPFDASYMLAYYILEVFNAGSKIEEMAKRAQKRALITHNPVKNLEDLVEVYKKLMFSTKGDLNES